MRVADIKVVDTLEDWFDVLVVLADSAGVLSAETAALASEFARRRSVYVMIPDGPDGSCRSDRTDRANLWEVHCPADGGEVRADSIWRFLRATNVRRPLVWTEGPPGYVETLDRASEAFKVVYAVAGPLAPDILQRCDFVVAPNDDVAEQAVGEADLMRATGRWAAADGYSALEHILCRQLNALLGSSKNLNVLVLYDDTFTHIKPIQEHLSAFGKHSKHNYFYFPVRADSTLFQPFEEGWPNAWSFDDYDAVVWHYCLRAAHETNIDPTVIREFSRYDGLKILFIQDDYDTTLTTWKWIEQAGIHLVMTCIPAYGIPYAFPDWKPGVVEFLQTHTGFVPEDDMDRFIVPMEERAIHLAYRGRTLPYRYGSLGREKYLIGVRMKELAAERGVPADIAVDDAGRIYGDDWYRFTAGARATLASETGSHVFDFDGSLTKFSEQMQKDGVPYDEFFDAHLAELETHVRMNQVSPRIFEAVRLKTALVCFEGEYSGAILPNEHYIPLKKDFSNVDEVFAKLEDVEALKAMTERAYRDVIESDKWSHAAFIRRFDSILESRLLRKARSELIAATIARRRRGNAGVEAVPRLHPFEYVLSTGVLRDPVKRFAFGELMADRRAMEGMASDFRTRQAPTPPSEAEVIGRIEPEFLRATEAATLTPISNGVMISTGQAPWEYAAHSPLDLESGFSRHEHHWIRAVFKDVEGAFLITCFHDQSVGHPFETPVPEGPGESIVAIPVGYADTSFLIRSGERPGKGSCTFVGAEILRAPAYEAGVLAIARELAMTSSHLVSSPEGQQSGAYQLPRPHAAPADARPVFLVTAAADQLALGGGGQMVLRPDGAAIRIRDDWNYGAVLDLDLSGARLDQQYGWVRLTVKEGAGDMRVALWSPADNAIGPERPVPWGPQERVIELPIQDLRFRSVLFRKGYSSDEATGVFICAEVVVAPMYPEALRRIAEQLALAPPTETPRGPVQTKRPPEDAEVVRRTSHADSAFYPGGSGEIIQSTDYARIVVAENWGYGAVLRLNLTGIDLGTEHCWIRVAVRSGDGNMRVCLWAESENEIGSEQMIDTADVVQQIDFVLTDVRFSSILFRKSESDRAGRADFIRAEVLRRPIRPLGA